VLAKVLSSAVLGIDAYRVEVEVDITSGLPSFSTVGLPEASVKESKERVKSAIANSGYRFPDDRITVNLAPADIKKEGTGFDLPIALGILAATGIIPQEALSRHLVLGELSLDGRVKPVRGSLPMAISARQWGHPAIIVPHENGLEASVVGDIDVLPVKTLSEVVEFLSGQQVVFPAHADVGALFEKDGGFEVDFAEVRGQEHAKRALEIAAAGGHNLIMIGPPGSGKTMLAKRLPTILPPLTFAEAIETTKVFSVVGMLEKDQALITRRPFRSPHHTISDAGLIGGGHQIHRYRSKISGPLLDRIDIHMEVPAVPYQHLLQDAQAEPSAEIRRRVSRARDLQSQRFARSRIFCNAQMGSRHIRAHCRIDDACRRLLEAAIDKLGLSARAFNRVLKIARTIADLQGAADIGVAHVSEAIQYRSLDRGSRVTP
jgi:predicted ATPase with chaperone activity